MRVKQKPAGAKPEPVEVGQYRTDERALYRVADVENGKAWLEHAVTGDQWPMPLADARKLREVRPRSGSAAS